MNESQKITELVKARADQEKAEYPPEPIEESSFTSKEILKALGQNEDGDAWLFIELHQGRFVFDCASARWFTFSGHYWVEDLLGDAMAGMTAVIEIYGQEAQRQAWQRLKAEKAGQETAAKVHAKNENLLLKRIRVLQSVRRKNDVLLLARTGKNSLAITGQEWDTNPWLLACANGIIDLKTGEHRPGRPDDYIKNFAPIEWQGIDTPCPEWEHFLSEVFCGDAELIAFLQRLFGYAVSGLQQEHIVAILWGSGRNGKSVSLETLGYVLGTDLAGPIEAEMLLQQTHLKQAGSPSSHILGLRGKRLVWASETSEGRRLDPGKLKWLTGGDSLTGRGVYGRHTVSFQPTHTTFLCTNSKPSAPGNDFALWSRIILIPFNVRFVDRPVNSHEKKRDSGLADKLKKESAGILAWLIRGCLEWQRIGLNPPEMVKVATEAYQKEEDLIGAFINECCELNQNSETKGGILYTAYQNWIEDMGHRSLSGTRFGKDMKERFSWEQRRHVFYLGIQLARQN